MRDCKSSSCVSKTFISVKTGNRSIKNIKQCKIALRLMRTQQKLMLAYKSDPISGVYICGESDVDMHVNSTICGRHTGTLIKPFWVYWQIFEYYDFWPTIEQSKNIDANINIIGNFKPYTGSYFIRLKCSNYLAYHFISFILYKTFRSFTQMVRLFYDWMGNDVIDNNIQTIFLHHRGRYFEKNWVD